MSEDASSLPQAPVAPAPALPTDPPRRRRGRPTKAEVAARQAIRTIQTGEQTPFVAPKPVGSRGALSTAVAEDLRELAAGAAGLRVWQWLSMREPKLWPSLVVELPPEQKASLIVHLLCKGHSALIVANKLGLMPNYVRDLWRDYSARIGDEVLGVTLPGLVGRIESRAEALVDMAVEDNKPAIAWRIEKERVELLQDLGVVERAAKRFEVAHQHTLKSGDDVDAETKAEVDRILEIERKKRHSEERVKRISARVMDHVPEGTVVSEGDE